LDNRRLPGDVHHEALTKANNCLLGPDGSIIRRPGTEKFTTTTTWSSIDLSALGVDGMWGHTRTDGTEYIYVAAGGTVFYSTGGDTYTKLEYAGSVAVTYTAGSRWFFASYLNKVYGVNGQDPVTTAAGHTSDRVLVIDGTTCTGETTEAKWSCQAADFVILHDERLWAMSRSTDPNVLFHSQAGTADSWENDNDGNFWNIGLNDGEIATGIASFKEGIYISKTHQNYHLSTLSRQYTGTTAQDTTDDWELEKVDGLNSDMGCVSHGSMKVWKDGLAYQSWSGVVWFDGRDIHHISKNAPGVNDTPQSDKSTHWSLLQNQDNWQHASASGGNYNQTNGVGYNLFPHTLRQQLFYGKTAFDGLGSHGGTKVVEAWKNNGQQYLTLDSLKDSFDGDNFTTSPVWTVGASSSSWVHERNSADTGSIRCGGLGNGYTLQKILQNKITTPITVADDGYWGITAKPELMSTKSEFGIYLIDNSGDGYFFAMRNGAPNEISIHDVSGGVYDTAALDSAALNLSVGSTYRIQAYRSGTTVTLKVNGTQYATSSGGAFSGNFTTISLISEWCHVRFENYWEDTTEGASGIYTSAKMDMGAQFENDIDATTPAATMGHIGYNAYLPEKGGANPSSITFQVRAAATEGGLDSETFLSVADGQRIDDVITIDRWFQWRVQLENQSSSLKGFSIPRIYGISIGATWYSNQIDLAAAPTNWGQFQVTDSPNDIAGDIRYYFRTKATNDMGAVGDAWDEVFDTQNLQSATTNGTPLRYLQFKVEIDTNVQNTYGYIGDYTRDMSELHDYDPDGDGLGVMPYLNSLKLTHYTGTDVKPSVAFIHNNRYYLSLCNTDSEKNNVMWSADPNFFKDESFVVAPFTGPHYFLYASAVAEYKNLILFGDSREGTVWIWDSGNYDDQRAIRVWARTASLDLDVPSFKKAFKVANPKVKSVNPYYIGTSIDGAGFSNMSLKGDIKQRTFRRPLEGNNAGEKVMFEFRSGVENFILLPSETLPRNITQSAGANFYQHQDNYLYAKIDNSDSTIRRWSWPVVESLTLDTDRFGFWAWIAPISLANDSITMFGFFNPDDITTNKKSFAGVYYTVESGTDTWSVGTGDDAGNLSVTTTSGSEFALTASATGANNYFIDYKMNSGQGVLRLLDANRNTLGVITKKIDTAAGATFDKITQVGIMNFTQAGGEETEWWIKGFGFYDPAQAPSGINQAHGDINISGADVEFIQMDRPVKGLK
jgi:hypothetical protein